MVVICIVILYLVAGYIMAARKLSTVPEEHGEVINPTAVLVVMIIWPAIMIWNVWKLLCIPIQLLRRKYLARARRNG
jgi:hypothetical protein